MQAVQEIFRAVEGVQNPQILGHLARALRFGLFFVLGLFLAQDAMRRKFLVYRFCKKFLARAVGFAHRVGFGLVLVVHLHLLAEKPHQDFSRLAGESGSGFGQGS